MSGLGKTVLKMFLQISSVVKWMVKYFIAESLKSVAKAESKVQETKQETILKNEEPQNFRSREINRFFANEIINQKEDLDMESREFDSIFEENKEKILNHQRKLLSLCPSDTPLILQDAVETLVKKGEYIEKYVSMKENLQSGKNQIEQFMTGQGIIEKEIFRNNEVKIEKLKKIYSKMFERKLSKKETKNFQVQVSLAAEDKETHLKETEQIIQLASELESKKEENSKMKIELEVYRRKINSSLEKIEFFEVERKKSILSRFNQGKSSRNEKNSSKNVDKKKSLAGNPSITFDIEPKSSSKITNSKPKITNFQELQSKKIISTNKSIDIEKIASRKKLKTVSIYSNPSINNIIKCCEIENKVYELQLGLEEEYSKNVLNEKFSEKKLKLEKAFSLKINKSNELNLNGTLIKLTKFENQSQLSPRKSYNSIKSALKNSRKEIPLSSKICPTSTNFTRTPNYEDETKVITTKKSIKLIEKNINSESFFMEKNSISHDEDKEKKAPFDKIYNQTQIKNQEINVETMCHFFKDESSARNYEILNVSENMHLQKRKKSESRKLKHASENTSLTVSPCRFRKSRPSCPDHRNFASKFISRKIYHQLINLRKNNKELYTKIVIFFRNPFSIVNKANELLKNISEFDEISIDLNEIEFHMNRIWSLHANCPSEKMNNFSKDWCSHKRFIVEFFGFEENLKNV